MKKYIILIIIGIFLCACDGSAPGKSSGSSNDTSAFGTGKYGESKY